MHDHQESALGSCPICGTTIGTGRTLTEYESDGTARTYAECPDCLNIVHPE